MAELGAWLLRGFAWMLDFKFLVGTLLGWRFVNQVGAMSTLGRRLPPQSSVATRSTFWNRRCLDDPRPPQPMTPFRSCRWEQLGLSVSEEHINKLLGLGFCC